MENLERKFETRMPAIKRNPKLILSCLGACIFSLGCIPVYNPTEDRTAMQTEQLYRMQTTMFAKSLEEKFPKIDLTQLSEDYKSGKDTSFFCGFLLDVNKNNQIDFGDYIGVSNKFNSSQQIVIASTFHNQTGEFNMDLYAPRGTILANLKFNLTGKPEEHFISQIGFFSMAGGIHYGLQIYDGFNAKRATSWMDSPLIDMNETGLYTVKIYNKDCSYYKTNQFLFHNTGDGPRTK